MRLPLSATSGPPSGPLAVESGRFRQILERARAAGPLTDVRERASLRVGPDGVAVVVVDGVLSKGGGWFGASTVAVRAQLRDAAAREGVRAILLKVSSPGGFVDGTADLAADVAAAAAAKPLEAYVEDIGGSAAYWVASQATRVWANATALVGSIGTYQVLWDESDAFRQMGVKVHVVSTGPLKGAGEPGTEITPEILKSEQTLVDDLNEHFLAAVRKGRGMTPKQVEAVATGEVWIAAKAKALGLVDGVRTFDEVLDGLVARADGAARRRTAGARLAVARARAPFDAEPRPRRDAAAVAVGRAQDAGR